MNDVDLARLNIFDKTGFPLPYKRVFKTWCYPPAVAPADASFLPDDAEVLAVETDSGDARAYPVRTIQSHHIVQDRIGDQEVLVTF